jgi:perosamine synthetase
MQGTGGDDIHPRVGYNFKLTNLQAAVGLGQLTRLETRLERMKRTYQIYVEGLSGLEEISLPGFQIEQGEMPQWTDAVVERRDDLDDYLRAHNIQCRRFWWPLHTQAPYRLPDDNFPHSTRLMPQALWLPSAFTLSDADIETICWRIRKFCQSE